jgi:hypothetical protein
VKKQKPVVLPMVMSELIDISLRDLARAEKTPGYAIDMVAWHCPRSMTEYEIVASVCSVCLAGSVMAFSLGVAATVAVVPDSRSMKANRAQLEAINLLRTGEVFEAACRLGMTPKLTGRSSTCTHDAYAAARYRFEAFDTGITGYSTDRALFKRDMRNLGARLRRAGL